MPPTSNNLTAVIDEVSALLASDPSISPALRALIKLMIGFIEALAASKLNSRNSSKPPSTDPNREKKKRSADGRKRGGQPGRKGTTLALSDKPDEVTTLSIDRATLPKGRTYTALPHERRQVFDIEVHRVISEYQAEVLVDDLGKRYTAAFPPHVKSRVQYGDQLKSHAIYLSQYQLLPYDRLREYFADQLGLPLSAASLIKFNQRVFDQLAPWEESIKEQLRASPLLQADETGLNLDGKRHWLHLCSNDRATLMAVHKKRGGDAIEAMDVLPKYSGVLCHDHWKPYYSTATKATHSLCNAHHLRELTWSEEQGGMAWAKVMSELLYALNDEVDAAGGKLEPERQEAARKRYREILQEGVKHCPPPQDTRKPGQKGRLKRSKSRNLLERLQSFEDDVLRFMTREDIPFTNNLAENDIRMTKVQQKISGCFRSQAGAEVFCRVRSYLSTCRKNGISATDGVRAALRGEASAGLG